MDRNSSHFGHDDVKVRDGTLRAFDARDMSLVTLPLSLRGPLAFALTIVLLALADVPFKFGNPLFSGREFAFQILPLEFGPLRAGKLLWSGFVEDIAETIRLFATVIDPGFGPGSSSCSGVSAGSSIALARGPPAWWSLLPASTLAWFLQSWIAFHRCRPRPHNPKAALTHPLQGPANLHVGALAKCSVLLKESRKLIHLRPRREKVMENGVSHLGTSEWKDVAPLIRLGVPIATPSAWSRAKIAARMYSAGL